MNKRQNKKRITKILKAAGLYDFYKLHRNTGERIAIVNGKNIETKCFVYQPFDLTGDELHEVKNENL